MWPLFQELRNNLQKKKCCQCSNLKYNWPNTHFPENNVEMLPGMYVNRNVLHLQNSFCLHILASHYFFCRLYNPMRIKDLAALDPNTPWLEYINKILSPDIIQVCRNITPCKVFIILLTHFCKSIFYPKGTLYQLLLQGAYDPS